MVLGSCAGQIAFFARFAGIDGEHTFIQWSVQGIFFCNIYGLVVFSIILVKDTEPGIKNTTNTAHSVLRANASDKHISRSGLELVPFDCGTCVLHTHVCPCVGIVVVGYGVVCLSCDKVWKSLREKYSMACSQVSLCMVPVWALTEYSSGRSRISYRGAPTPERGA